MAGKPDESRTYSRPQMLLFKKRLLGVIYFHLFAGDCKILNLQGR